MTIQIHESSSRDDHTEGDFIERGLRLENVECLAFGYANEEPIEHLEATSAEIHNPSRPRSVQLIPDVPNGEVSLHNFSLLNRRFDLTVGGMSVQLEHPAPEFARLRSYGGPYSFDRPELARLGNSIHRINKHYLHNFSVAYVSQCAVALYFDSPASIDDMVADAITRAKREQYTSPNSTMIHHFGSVRCGREVKVSNRGANTKSVELVFYEDFIKQFTRGGTDAGFNLPDLVRELIAVTLGDETLPSAFFRIASKESQGLPGSLRRNDPTWEKIRRAFLRAVTDPGSVRSESVRRLDI